MQRMGDRTVQRKRARYRDQREKHHGRGQWCGGAGFRRSDSYFVYIHIYIYKFNFGCAAVVLSGMLPNPFILHPPQRPSYHSPTPSSISSLLISPRAHTHKHQDPDVHQQAAFSRVNPSLPAPLSHSLSVFLSLSPRATFYYPFHSARRLCQLLNPLFSLTVRFVHAVLALATAVLLYIIYIYICICEFVDRAFGRFVYDRRLRLYSSLLPSLRKFSVYI